MQPTTAPAIQDPYMQPPAPAPAPTPVAEPAPAPAPTPAPAPAPVVTGPPIPPVSIDPGVPKKRIMGGILLGAGVALSAIATVTFAGKAGQTAIGSQGLVTFDSTYYTLQPRIPRVVLGASFGITGAVLAGVGGNMFARNAGLEGDPVNTLKRQRRLRSSSAILIGAGGATFLSGALLVFYGFGEWASVPDVIFEFRPEYAQSAHNAAAFYGWGAGLLAVGSGTLATGLGLLMGNIKAIRAGVMADRNGGGLSISGKF